MKKTLTIFSLVLAIVFLAGCGKKTEQTKNENQNQTTAQNKETEQGGSVVNSIKDAMGLGKKMQCTYTMQINGQPLQTESFIDGSNHKIITTINEEKNYSVLDGDMIYTWSEADKKGTKISMKCIEDLKTQTEENPQTSPSSTENFKTNADDFKDAMNVSCVSVSSIDLSVPNDIEFTDNCEMMKKSLEMMKQYQNQGANVPMTPPAGAFPEGVNAQ